MDANAGLDPVQCSPRSDAAEWSDQGLYHLPPLDKPTGSNFRTCMARSLGYIHV